MRQSFHKCLVHVPDIGDTAANKTKTPTFMEPMKIYTMLDGDKYYG